MAKQIFAANKLTGGVAGALDDINHTSLEDGNIAIVIAASVGKTYFYKYNASDASAESSPDIIIPDSNGTGSGAWNLIDVYTNDLTVGNDLNVTNDADIDGNLNVDGNTTLVGTLGVTGAATAASLQLGGAGATPTEFSVDGTMAGLSDTAVPTEQAITEYLAMVLAGTVQRSHFVHNNGFSGANFTVRCEPGLYYCKDKLAKWASDITTAAISSPVAETWYYLYLDYSAITSHTDITSSELIWSDTAPSWNDTYRGWYNGDDRCIFAAIVNSSAGNLKSFLHEGDLYSFIADYETRALSDIDDSWETTTLDIPEFATKAYVYFLVDPTGETTATSLYWRTKDQAGDGFFITRVDQDIDPQQKALPWIVLTNSSQQIEVIAGSAGDTSIGIYTNGYFFPRGM